MENLVTIENNQPFTTSLAIAEGTNNEHRGVLQLIKRHSKRFERFGELRLNSAFEMQNFERSKQGRPTMAYSLNEPQATLLLTMMKNTPKVLDFKVALVEAFFKARDLLMTGQMGLLQAQAILHATKDQEKQKASICGKGLSDWKKKRDALDNAIKKVEHQIQPQLTDFEQALAS